jgi:acetyltransferase-like isoleucine patch superfamily enzyme
MISEITGEWDYTTLPSNVRVGSGCFIERKDSFERFRSTQQVGLALGNHVQVYTWTTFNIEPAGSVSVGDESILVGAVFMCAESISIGKRVVISYNVTIADCDFHPRDPQLRRQDAIASAPFGDRDSRPPLVTRPVLIEDDVWIGIGAMVMKGVHVGRGAWIGPGAVVFKSVPAGARVEGNPARTAASESE